MRKFHLSAVLALALDSAAFAQPSPFAGRWDMTLKSQTGDAYPQWLEIIEKDGGLSGRYQPRGGASRPLVSAKLESGHLILTLTDPTAKTAATTWDLTADGGKLQGVEKQGEKLGPEVAGVRAPDLKRAMPKAWGKPKAIFNGKDLAGWEPVGTAANKWIARGGELVNDNPETPGARVRAANIKTTGKFQDFKLHIEVNCPEHGNSGIYLRGRYEIQVGTEGGTQPSHEMGAVYGYFAPAGNIGNKLGEWTAFDITLVGRTLTVVRDGVKIHDNIEIPGLTGGALDSHESEPGPFFLQGDHHGVIRYRNITVQEPAK